MKNINVTQSDGNVSRETIYNIKDFPYSKVKTNKTVAKQFTRYINIVATFDIETTTVQIGDKKEGFMYIWQFCIGNYVVMGRTWKEYITFIEKLSDLFNLKENKRLVIWVHNLAFEFQFIRQFFFWQNVFAKEKRTVLKAVDSKNYVEYRCSYFLTNMSLEKACENAKGCTYWKKSGEEFDYSKIRKPSTELTDKELEYCFCDVRGLSQVIDAFLEDDTLATIPMTSTGFVRRDCRNAMRKNPENRKLFLKCAVDKEVYTLLEEAKRGGNTSANRLHVGNIIENVFCFDVASSYPFVMMTKYYPISCFMKIGNIDSISKMRKYLDKYCCLFRIAFENLTVKEDVPIPYISHHKLNHTSKKDILFNGRVLHSDACDMTLTEIDYNIIEQQYTWDRVAIGVFYIAERGELPKELKDTIRDYFEKKTQLKKKDYYLYMKSKNKLNSIFGMMCTNPVHNEIYINEQTGEWEEIPGDVEKELEKYYKSRNSFLSIQNGVWVTAHARAWLQRAIDLTGMNTLYVDTDSDKALNVPDGLFDDLNKEAIELAEKYGAYADHNGKRYYMGVFEQEETYNEFRTWGAKKYCAITGDSLTITTAGVGKKQGSAYLSEHGGIRAFCPGFVWSGQKNGGGTESHWNDDSIHVLRLGNEEIHTGANVGILDSSYTLGVTEEFLENMEFNIDKVLYM